RRRSRRCRAWSWFLSPSEISGAVILPAAARAAAWPCEFQIRSVQFVSNRFEVAGAFDPALAHIGVGRLVLRQHEAGMLHAQPRAGLHFRQREGDDGVERRAVADIALVAAAP